MRSRRNCSRGGSEHGLTEHSRRAFRLLLRATQMRSHGCSSPSAPADHLYRSTRPAAPATILHSLACTERAPALNSSTAFAPLDDRHPDIAPPRPLSGPSQRATRINTSSAASYFPTHLRRSTPQRIRHPGPASWRDERAALESAKGECTCREGCSQPGSCHRTTLSDGPRSRTSHPCRRPTSWSALSRATRRTSGPHTLAILRDLNNFSLRFRRFSPADSTTRPFRRLELALDVKRRQPGITRQMWSHRCENHPLEKGCVG